MSGAFLSLPETPSRRAQENQSLYVFCMHLHRRFRRLRGLRCGSVAARLKGLLVRILPVAWMSVSSECCVLSGRGLCDGLIIRPEEPYRVWCV